ncbi:hypothetical protein HMPREF1255_1114 [Propionimicrobium sp. BV2F7]|nr:hypothetical protein HMPREF1255_1114 [Propionimicrobium sp. BV2F7]
MWEAHLEKWFTHYFSNVLRIPRAVIAEKRSLLAVIANPSKTLNLHSVLPLCPYFVD